MQTYHSNTAEKAQEEEWLNDPTLTPEYEEPPTHDIEDLKTETEYGGGIIQTEALLQRVASLPKTKMFVNKYVGGIVNEAVEYFKSYKGVPSEKTLETLLKDKYHQSKDWVLYRSTLKTMLFAVPSLHTMEWWLDQITEKARLAAYKKAIDDLLNRKIKPNEFNRAVTAAAQEFDRATNRRRAFSIEEILTWQPGKWLVKNMIPAESFICVYGAPGSYKSFFCLDLCLAMASGLPFLGEWNAEQAATLYIAGEGQSGVPNRLRAWMNAKGIEADALKGRFAVIPSRFNLCDADEAEAIAQIAQESLGELPKLIVIDTLSRNFLGNENAPDDMSKFVATVDHLRELTGSTIMVLHHSGKDETKRARGHTSLPGANDTIIELVKEDEQFVTVKCMKQKETLEFAPFVCVAQAVDTAVTDESGQPVTSLVLTHHQGLEEAKKRTVESLRKRELARWVALLPLTESDAITSEQLRAEAVNSGLAEVNVTLRLIQKKIADLVADDLACTKRDGRQNLVWRSDSGAALVVADGI